MQKITKAKMILKYVKPASPFSAWESSLPIGNGKVGALIQGGVRYEKLMISDYRANWLGSVGVLPDVSDKIKEVRRSVDAKNQVMAGMVFEKAFETKKYAPTIACPLPIADLVLKQEIFGKHVTGYFRQVNMENGEASVRFSDMGTKIDRSCFVSFDNDCLFYEISKEGNNSLNFEVSLVPHDYKYSAFDGKKAPELNVESELGSNFIIFNQEYNGFNYGACVRVVTDAKATFQIVGNVLKIDGAERVVLILKTFVGKNKAKEIDTVKNELLSIKQVNYDKLFKDHYGLYQKAFGKAELSIADEKENTIDNLMAEFNQESTLLYEKLFHFAKYLNVCGMNEVSFPAYLTGLWSFHYANNKAVPDTSCAIPALYSSSVHLGFDHIYASMVNYFEKYSDDLKKNSYRIYKSKGYMVPQYLASGSGLPASTKAKDLSVVASGAVIANSFYEYFQITKDVKYLKTVALPFMFEVANFYLNYFYINDRGEFMCCPSYSPYGKSKYFEHKDIGVYYNSSCDIAVVRSLLVNIINACNNYGINQEKVIDYQNFLNELPKIKVTRNVINEFASDDNSNLSAGFLHMYAVYGSKDINANSNPASIAPFLNSVVNKIDKCLFAQNIVSLGRLAEISSILGQGEATFNILRYMVSNFLSKNGLFLNYDKNNMCAYVDGDNYFNMCGNMLLLNSIVNAFVLSYGNNISIMNAKPAIWKSGKIEGIYTTQNVIVDVVWDDKRGTAFINLKAIKNTTFNLLLFKGAKKVKGYQIDPNNPFIENIKLASNRTLVLEVKY